MGIIKFNLMLQKMKGSLSFQKMLFIS